MVLLVPTLECSVSIHVPNLMLLRLKQIHALVLVLAGQKVATGHLRDSVDGGGEVVWSFSRSRGAVCVVSRKQTQTDRQKLPARESLRPRRHPRDTHRDDDPTRTRPCV